MPQPLEIHFRSGYSEQYRSIREAADALGLPNDTFAKAVRGRRFPHQSKYQKLYDQILQVSLEETCPQRTMIKAGTTFCLDFDQRVQAARVSANRLELHPLSHHLTFQVKERNLPYLMESVIESVKAKLAQWETAGHEPENKECLGLLTVLGLGLAYKEVGVDPWDLDTVGQYLEEAEAL